MLNRNEIQVDLIRKLNELCQKANVKYVLHGHGAFLAYYGEPFEEINSLEVLMCQGDAERISDILDDDAYYFEDSRSNPKFDKHYMMFGFRDSLDLKHKDLNFRKTRYLENHCIRITIHFIEQIPRRITGKILRTSRKLSKRHVKVSTYDYNNFQRKQKICNNIFGIIGDENYSRKMYNFKKKKISIDTWDDIPNYPLIKITGKRPIESEIFDSISKVEIADTYSYIISDFEEYARHYYGRNWEEKKWARVNRYTSSLISWQDCLNDPDVKECLDNIQKNYEIIYEEYARTREERKIVRAAKRQIRQSESVIHTREDYLNQKDDLVRIYESGNIEELEEALLPLIRSEKNGVRRGYTYSVDEDIDNILDSYLRKAEREKLADNIIKYRIDI